MPHFIVEYSANIEEEMDLDGLLKAVHTAALKTGVFPLGGIRVRASKRDHYIIADGDAQNSFVHVVSRIREGRPIEVRKEAGDAVMAAICDHLQPVFGKRPLAISFEIQEIDMRLNFKKNNIHDYLKNKES